MGKLVRAQELMREAGDEIISARLNTVRISGAAEDDFRGTALDRALDGEAALLIETAQSMDPMIRELAELIPKADP